MYVFSESDIHALRNKELQRLDYLKLAFLEIQNM